MTRQLETILKSGDPAAGDPGLGPAESSRMRRAILDAAPQGQAHARWIPALVGGLVAAASLLLVLLAGLPEPESPARIAPGQAVDANLTGAARGGGPPRRRLTSPGERPSRTIYFVAPGGTRVVWTLDPDFDV